MDYKIIQIIPGNANIYAIYEDVIGGEIGFPIVCMALVEYEDGVREVKIMDIANDGEIDFPSKNLNFLKVACEKPAEKFRRMVKNELCICENGRRYQTKSCTHRVRSWTCRECGETRKIIDCGCNHMLYDCPYCGEHLT